MIDPLFGGSFERIFAIVIIVFLLLLSQQKSFHCRGVATKFYATKNTCLFITVTFDEFVMLPKCKQTADAKIKKLNLLGESLELENY